MVKHLIFRFKMAKFSLTAHDQMPFITNLHQAPLLSLKKCFRRSLTGQSQEIRSA
jgi:hypothetical protein